MIQELRLEPGFSLQGVGGMFIVGDVERYGTRALESERFGPAF